jgi:hypothetical protein
MHGSSSPDGWVVEGSPDGCPSAALLDYAQNRMIRVRLLALTGPVDGRAESALGSLTFWNISRAA